MDALRGSPARFRSVELEIACDVRTRFVEAAAVFAPQKGASPAQVGMLTARLSQLAQRYRDELGVDVTELVGGGAAGGLAGGLAALGGRIVPGFELVAEHVDLPEQIAAADAVVTGEGYLDAQSLEGKVVGGVCELAAAAGKPVVVIAGDADADVVADLEGPGVSVVSLVARFGATRPFDEPRWCIEHAGGTRCGSRDAPRPIGSGGGVVAAPAGGAVTVAAARSASVLPAVSVPTITRTVPEPRPCWIGGGIGIGPVCTPPMSVATSGGDGLGRGVAVDVVHDRRREVLARRVARRPHRVAGSRSAPASCRRPTRGRRWRWRPRPSPRSWPPAAAVGAVVHPWPAWSVRPVPAPGVEPSVIGAMVPSPPRRRRR